MHDSLYNVCSLPSLPQFYLTTFSESVSDFICWNVSDLSQVNTSSSKNDNVKNLENFQQQKDSIVQV